MSHKSLYDTLFSIMIHKADFIGQCYNVVSNEAKKSTYLIGSLNVLLTWRRRENIFKTFMGMKRSGWEMAPRVYTSVQIKQLCKSWIQAITRNLTIRTCLQCLIGLAKLCYMRFSLNISVEMVILIKWNVSDQETLKPGNSPNITTTGEKFRQSMKSCVYEWPICLNPCFLGSKQLCCQLSKCGFWNPKISNSYSPIVTRLEYVILLSYNVTFIHSCRPSLTNE